MKSCGSKIEKVFRFSKRVLYLSCAAIRLLLLASPDCLAGFCDRVAGMAKDDLFIDRPEDAARITDMMDSKRHHLPPIRAEIAFAFASSDLDDFEFVALPFRCEVDRFIHSRSYSTGFLDAGSTRYQLVIICPHMSSFGSD